MEELETINLESSDLVKQTFDFWFNGKDHIRSPFPEYIRTDLVRKSVERLAEWTAQLTESAAKEVNDVIVGEKFEEIVFETALGLVHTEDERLTINYPFMPRLGDKIEDGAPGNKQTSTVIERSVLKEGDLVFLNVELLNEVTQEKWETKFELPV